MNKLIKIQCELKAPKNQYNAFGKYKYRNCEDILEALKPVLDKHNCSCIISDDVIIVGSRVYIKATATLIDNESEKTISATGMAREAGARKGMDESQVTGATSSYARKYALNGLFMIDDTKDPDTKPSPEPVIPTTTGNLEDKALEEAIKSANNAQTLDALQKVWDKWAVYHANDTFKRKVTARKTQLKN